MVGFGERDFVDTPHEPIDRKAHLGIYVEPGGFPAQTT